ncbi:MAG: hypothetical protein GX803_00830 [Lentisphaerae bacterium]|jgi:hypothetical protein|nr:hypothetical protein [Lentisphaerota bacterium]
MLMNNPGWFILAWAACAAIATASDPFADVQPHPVRPPASQTAPNWRENLLWRNELQAVATAGRRDVRHTDNVHVRLSVGFEAQKRLATPTKTYASVDYQGRLVYRQHPLNSANDPMAKDGQAWTYETHNAYVELYNLLGSSGRLHLRLGRYDLPFGLDSQTDTHGTLWQFSNHRLFGAGHDWQATAFGKATEHLDYQLGYLLGAGPNDRLNGQHGMLAGRLGLANTFLFAHGLEAGLSAAWGRRLDPHTGTRDPVSTWRLGLDARKRMDSPTGPFTMTLEAAVGEDEDDAIWSSLVQVDWLNPGRRWGALAQYVWLQRDTQPSRATDQRASAMLTRYFRNEVASSTLHWVALAVEHQLDTPHRGEDTLVTAQYYRFW